MEDSGRSDRSSTQTEVVTLYRRIISDEKVLTHGDEVWLVNLGLKKLFHLHLVPIDRELCDEFIANYTPVNKDESNVKVRGEEKHISASLMASQFGASPRGYLPNDKVKSCPPNCRELFREDKDPYKKGEGWHLAMLKSREKQRRCELIAKRVLFKSDTTYFPNGAMHALHEADPTFFSNDGVDHDLRPKDVNWAALMFRNFHRKIMRIRKATAAGKRTETVIGSVICTILKPELASEQKWELVKTMVPRKGGDPDSQHGETIAQKLLVLEPKGGLSVSQTLVTESTTRPSSSTECSPACEGQHDFGRFGCRKRRFRDRFPINPRAERSRETTRKEDGDSQKEIEGFEKHSEGRVLRRKEKPGEKAVGKDLQRQKENHTAQDAGNNRMCVVSPKKKRRRESESAQDQRKKKEQSFQNTDDERIEQETREASHQLLALSRPDLRQSDCEQSMRDQCSSCDPIQQPEDMEIGPAAAEERVGARVKVSDVQIFRSRHQPSLNAIELHSDSAGTLKSRKESFNSCVPGPCSGTFSDYGEAPQVPSSIILTHVRPGLEQTLGLLTDNKRCDNFDDTYRNILPE